MKVAAEDSFSNKISTNTTLSMAPDGYRERKRSNLWEDRMCFLTGKHACADV